MKMNTLNSITAVFSFLMVACTSGMHNETGHFSAEAEERAIREVLQSQEIAWNEGNLEEFMEGYWKSDSLRFIGNGITTGWQATLDRYHRSYPDRAAMGQLTFEFYRFHFIDPVSCLVTGRYRLKREADEPTGMFTLLVKKIDGKWLIAYDHTS